VLEERYCAQAVFMTRAAFSGGGTITLVAVKAPAGTRVYAPRDGQLLNSSAALPDASGMWTPVPHAVFSLDDGNLPGRSFVVTFYYDQPKDPPLPIRMLKAGDVLGRLDEVVFSQVGDYNLVMNWTKITRDASGGEVFTNDIATMQALFPGR
jgi:hypothetical protein